LKSLAALTPGINVPSARFRIRQYIPKLEATGIKVREFPARLDYTSNIPGLPGKIDSKPIKAAWYAYRLVSRIPDIIQCNRFEAVWLNRVTANPFYIEKLIRKPLIYDVDDAIWINNEKLIAKIGKKAEIIFAGNAFIANWFEKYNPNVHIIPTSIDTNRFFEIEKQKDQTFRIVWTGSSQTIHYLISIENVLKKFLDTYKNAKLIVVSDQNPPFTQISPHDYDFVPWTAKNEVKEIQKADVGLMPLNDSDWERGKCSYKMLQYMACGLPVIVSPVGMNNEVLSMGSIGFGPKNDKEWWKSLNDIYENHEMTLKMGSAGREIILKHFSMDVITHQIIDIFNKMPL
jgi:glycosyltransferase involved in cell wall biosynthesis